MFNLKSNFKPSGDQKKSIDELVKGLEENKKHQVLLGATGTGKTFTIANVIEKINKPTLVLAHNKTLAGQLYSEFKEFFPDDNVEYFVSYYDYYQPEAYVPSKDMYIEKDASINDEIDELRHAATAAILSHKNTIVVASVSCIYGIGEKEEYFEKMITLNVGQEINRDDLLLRLVKNQYVRNDFELKRGSFRVRGDVLEIIPVSNHSMGYRIEFFGDEIDRISEIDPLTGMIRYSKRTISLFPATHFVVNEEKIERSLLSIEKELEERLEELKKLNKLVEYQRLKEKTKYDIEMIRETGFCSGIENYSRHFSFKNPGEAPTTLVDFFGDNFLLIVDESHVTLPQVRGMYNGDRARKETLVNYGFRLPSALDNRPLKFEEFADKIDQAIYISATPGDYELDLVDNKFVEQIIRPTYLLDPLVEVRPITNQVDDILNELKALQKKGEKALVTTLTIKMSEELTAYLEEAGIKVAYLHSKVKTLERIEIIHDLRSGKYDCIVGINLLREGLDIPEVSLVAILDADKEGFLRSYRSLIQTIGRAARNVNGRCIMYADQITDSMKKAIDETKRRRTIQEKYNAEHGLVPKTVKKKIVDVIRNVEEFKTPIDKKKKYKVDLEKLEEEMNEAARNYDFEKAIILRDILFEEKMK